MLTQERRPSCEVYYETEQAVVLGGGIGREVFGREVGCGTATSKMCLLADS